MRSKIISRIKKIGLFVLCSGTLLSSAHSMARPSQPEQKQNSTTETILQQMRWKLEDTDWDFGTSLPLEMVLAASPEELDRLLRKEDRVANGTDRHRIALQRTVEALILKGDDASRNRALEILTKLVEIHHPGEVDAVVTKRGIEYPGVSQRQESGTKVYEITPPNSQRPTVLNVRDLAYEYAALYLLTGKSEYAAKTRDILLRFADVVAFWPLYDRDNKPHAQNEEKYLAHGEANGIWAVWSPLDLKESLTLLRAYDIIRPTLTSEENTRIRENFFIHQKDLNDRFSRHLDEYSNLTGYRLPPLILFGKVLERPDYVHEAVGYIQRLLRYSFTADGFWREVTPGYHRQITSRLMGGSPLAAKNYSDPAGYMNEKDGTRFDKLDLGDMFAVQFERIKKGLAVLAMPDGTCVSLNDSWPKKDSVDPSLDKESWDKPGLLGIAGVAKLGSKGMVAFLQFEGLRGHNQDCPLNLVWFAGGREVFSETGYQALPKSGSSRNWNSASASHNTVTVDENTGLREPGRLPEFLSVPKAGTPAAEGKPLQIVQPGAADYANQGRLLVWRTNSDFAQAMEAERENAYPGVTSLFRRTVVMIPEGNGDGILVDIFRIRGGKTHDFALRGGLDQPYKMTFDAPLQPASGTLFKFVQLRESAEICPPLLETTEYTDGYQVHSELSGLFGTPDAKMQLLVGEAPAIRRLGTAPFSFVRHQLTTSEGKLETCYVWVHEAGRERKIRSVRTEARGGNVVVLLERGNRTDFVFSGENDESHFDFEGWTFTGRLAFASTVEAAPRGLVFSGGKLERSGLAVAGASPSFLGSVIETTRRDAGANSDTLLVKLDGNAEGFLPRLVHVDFGKFIRFSIPVEKAVREKDAIRLELTHSPGFGLEDGKAVMSNSPGWAYAGIPTVRVDCETLSSNP